MFETRHVPAPPTAVTLRPMVNPRAVATVVPIFDGHQCVIVDDFLAEPETLVEYAALERERFFDSPQNYYPGPELPLTGRFVSSMHEAFLLHARTPLKARRVLSVNSRLSLVTRRPEQLLPGQRMPHRDSDGLAAMEGAGAMVLYLFNDERLGGTSFFKPKLPPRDIDAMLNEVRRMEKSGDSLAPGAPPTYAIASDEYFEKVLTVPPRFNRAIFYNGGLFHSGFITAPELLVADPTRGRLTVNAFFRLRMAAT